MKSTVKIYEICVIPLLCFVICFIIVNGSRNGRKEGDGLYAGAVHAVRHIGSMSRHMLAQEIDSDVNSTSTTPESTTREEKPTNQTMTAPLPITEMSDLGICPSLLNCSSQSVICFSCHWNYSCTYGAETEVVCKTRHNVQCQGSREFTKKMKCRYCYQTEAHEHSCIRNTTCRVVSAPRQNFMAKCRVHNNVLCLGNRLFPKNVLCNWTKGYSWSTALLLSISLGGLGADRFYLGLWQEGIGKLFSFGGLGVWTLVDVILIATGYLGPADGSLYIS